MNAASSCDAFNGTNLPTLPTYRLWASCGCAEINVLALRPGLDLSLLVRRPLIKDVI